MMLSTDLIFGGLIDRFQDASDVQMYPLVKEFLRIEATILRLENPEGISHTGFPCDIFDACDPKVIAFIDTLV